MSKKATSVKLYDLKPFLQMKASMDGISMGHLIRKILSEWKEANITDDEKKILLSGVRHQENKLRRPRSFIRVSVDNLYPVLKQRALDSEDSIYGVIRKILQKDLTDEEKKSLEIPCQDSVMSSMS